MNNGVKLEPKGGQMKEVLVRTVCPKCLKEGESYKVPASMIDQSTTEVVDEKFCEECK